MLYKYILVTVNERDIQIEAFDTEKEAYKEMKRQLFKEVLDCRANDYNLDDDYGFDDESAYANDIRHHNYDWRIHTICVNI